MTTVTEQLHTLLAGRTVVLDGSHGSPTSRFLLRVSSNDTHLGLAAGEARLRPRGVRAWK
jgi:predicted kinase